MWTKTVTLAGACALTLASAATAQQAGQAGENDRQGQRAMQAQRTQPTVDFSTWDLNELYRNGWSAERMLDTDVRGPNGEDIGELEDIIVGPDGQIQRVVVEVGGILDIGDSHIGVPWSDVRVGPNMEYIQVPATEENYRNYPLYDDRAPVAGNWRVQELIGDMASLTDVPRYGRVNDVIFGADGDVRAVIVDRTRGLWRAYGPYAYPYTGYYGGITHPLPYTAESVANQAPFSYVQLNDLSRFAGTGADARERQVEGMERPARQR